MALAAPPMPFDSPVVTMPRWKAGRAVDQDFGEGAAPQPAIVGDADDAMVIAGSEASAAEQFVEQDDDALRFAPEATDRERDRLGR
ncbi:hypothetical protein JL100_013140 [Skermanella mucosa]|uniref:hypothetical protein n=1 Tax=Skermanella mucosa TaxID=1789672 RepID=UPI00192AEFA8|nr:hypothetical protein [Skermanella mucosa]UEM23634.1 hypothetical protein JL100_013140 [Skermanella mucosa]